MVGPSGLVRKRQYSAPAMAAAFFRYAEGDSMAAVRRMLRPTTAVGVAAADGWVTLRRWLRAAGLGLLFRVGSVPSTAARHVAEHVTLVLVGRGGWRPGADRFAAALRGAVIAA
jgi:hypothetical protein